MSSYCIRKARINVLKLPKGYDQNKISIGIPVTNDEHIQVGLKEVGDVVLPSADFGPVCAKNANGYSYSDKTKKKKYRYVSTVWIQPYGNEDAFPVAVDICRKCYPKVEVPPMEIELILASDTQGNKYVAVNLTDEVREKYLQEAINILLEIYGFCWIYSDRLEAFTATPRQKCNWEILPPGENPSEHLKRQLEHQGKSTDTFDVDRLEFVEKYKPEKIVEGINGFNGYYAYIFNEHCVLESAIYGNATYIIPKENWETLSQKTKRELIDNKWVEEKIIHNQNWHNNFSQTMQELEYL